ncbi:MAG TPA: hypothetical protein PL196_03400, partial [Burkholderiaceae bacterium]|nr:hypothetical protein [Burkholderiaceae bacterium]
MRSPKRRWCALLVVFGGVAGSAPCRADEGDASAAARTAPPTADAGTDAEWDWDWAALRDDMLQQASLALGLATSWSSTSSYSGSGSQGLRPRAVWAFQYGRVRLSTGGGAA